MASEYPVLGLILLYPALGFLFNLFFGDRWGRRAVNIVGPGAIFAAFAIAAIAFVKLQEMPS